VIDLGLGFRGISVLLELCSDEEDRAKGRKEGFWH
jgi:hypothetical protein